MSEISITQAAFAGVRVLRRRPVTAVIWYVVSLAAALLGLYLISRTMGPALANMQQVQAAQRVSGAPADPQVAAAAMVALFQGVVMMVPIYLVLGAITTSAANRAVLRPQEDAFGYFRLGSDELRMIVVLLVIGLIVGVVYIVGVFVASLVAAIAGGALSGGAPDPVRLTITLLAALVPVAVILALLCLKFALAPAQTLDSHGISIFGSWSLTKGHLRAVILTYLMNAAIFVAIYLLLLGVSLEGGALISGQSPGKLVAGAPAPQSINDPSMIFRLLIGGLIGVAGQVLLVCPGAALYQQIARRGHEEAF